MNDSKLNIYTYYSPVKFYLLNKIIIDWIEENHKIENELPIIKNHFYLNHLQNKVLIFVQTQVFYIDLIDYIIINKKNNIPVPFDLFITTNTEEKNQKIF